MSGRASAFWDGKSCEGCVYWRAPETVTYRHGESAIVFGQCRRYPPARHMCDRGAQSLFPMTGANWVCGEHAVAEGGAS